MKIDELLKLEPKEFTNFMFKAFKEKKITNQQMRLICKKYSDERQRKWMKT